MWPFWASPSPTSSPWRQEKTQVTKSSFKGACYFLGIFAATMMMIKLKQQRHKERKAHWARLLGPPPLARALLLLLCEAASVPLPGRPTLSCPEAGVSSLIIFILYRSRVDFGEGNGNPLQYSCLENPMDRGAWWATVHGVTKSRT